VLPALFDRRHADVVERLGDAEEVLAEAAGDGVDSVLEAAMITERRRRVGATHLERLRDALDEVPAEVPVIYVPELFTRATGRRVVNLVSKALTDELDTGA